MKDKDKPFWETGIHPILGYKNDSYSTTREAWIDDNKQFRERWNKRINKEYVY